ncbi:MAG TPA: peroxiredoxin [Pyrinomonadaceae bacterium]|nr:peroxiredoxin [Pyrinomonadaceae bacterium]
MEATSPSARAALGEPAPDFALADEHGREWRLSEKRGRVVVLLFYPRDETPVCTRQMCSLRDRWADYRATGAEVVGISTDPPASHLKFAEHHHLPLHLLSDPGGRVAKTFGAASWIPGRAARAVVVIGADGAVRHLKTEPLSLFRPSDDQVLAAIRAAQGV